MNPEKLILKYFKLHLAKWEIFNSNSVEWFSLLSLHKVITVMNISLNPVQTLLIYAFVVPTNALQVRQSRLSYYLFETIIMYTLPYA